MSDGNLYRLLVTRVEEALRELKQAKSSELRDWINRNYPGEMNQLLPSWSTYLSVAAKSPDTEFEKQPGSYSYRLRADALGDDVLEDEDEGEEGAGSVKAQREKKLYPALVDWLKSQGYRASDTSASKKGGPWGNPDATGLRIVEDFLCQRTLEVVTIEAKVSLTNWKREFFEAVSHRRFAHRAYFAFAVGTDEPSLDSLASAADLRAYGEKFHVGVLVIFMPEALYEDLSTNPSPPEIPSDEVRVEELWPALFEQPDTTAKVHYLHRVLELLDDNDIYAFGTEEPPS